jgi:2-oxoglutarate dehydrogenase E2 component (dihydrolipoamide succinyltransferase)
MAQIKVPTLGESVSEATVAQWLKKEGDHVEQDEPIVELETDKVTLEVNAPESGTISSIIVKEGENVEVGALLGEIGEGSAANDSKPEKEEPAGKPENPGANDQATEVANQVESQDAHKLSPAVQKMISDNKLTASDIPASGKDGRLTKEDVQNFLEAKDNKSYTGDQPKAFHEKKQAAAPQSQPQKTQSAQAPRETGPREERVRMSRLRQSIAKRLKGAQETAAILTTFNEVDMTNIMQLRKEYQDNFVKKHNVKLGFMSFFVKAAVQALKEFPAVNAEIDGEDIVYKNYYDVGIAVSTPQGLIVPVVRDCDSKSMAQIEKDIMELGGRARDGKISLDEMQGGTFTITNGGVFGSLMATPILNAPQSAILGMHKIQQRPMVMPDGAIEARPMMYLALSYDHRIIDGRESVSFLVRIKEALEDPQRLLLDI